MAFSCIGKTHNIARPLGWLFAFFLLIQGPLPGLVLCFAANDHMAVEAPHSPFPHPTSESQVPCLDVPLVSVQSNESAPLLIPGLAQQGRIFVSTPALTPQPLFTTPALAGLVSSRALAATPPIAALRAVILLI
jgi:hypothetical protein